ncbi:MAG TPA: hypothetical protein VMD97_06015 [Candidatus Aquilonibacter sp.]|nr:hypothetical protein [Candidatus Aquilonibacter sp.]
MLFVNWRSVALIALASALAIAPVIFMWLVSRKVPQLWARILAAMIGTPLFLFGSGLAVMFIFFSLPSLSNFSQPARSPDGKYVVRAEYWGGFGSSGGTDIRIYSLRGLLSSLVYDGEYGSVPPDGIRWLDNRTLLILYVPDSVHTCQGTRSVKVRCLPETKTTHG